MLAAVLANAAALPRVYQTRVISRSNLRQESYPPPGFASWSPTRSPQEAAASREMHVIDGCEQSCRSAIRAIVSDTQCHPSAHPKRPEHSQSGRGQRLWESLRREGSHRLHLPIHQSQDTATGLDEPYRPASQPRRHLLEEGSMDLGSSDGSRGASERNVQVT